LKKEKRNRRKEISKERFHKNPLQETKWQQQSDSIVFTNCFRLASLSCSPVLFCFLEKGKKGDAHRGPIAAFVRLNSRFFTR
jgi:hypothetical protein